MSSYRDVEFTLRNYVAEHARVLDAINYDELAIAVGIVDLLS